MTTAVEQRIPAPDQEAADQEQSALRSADRRRRLLRYLVQPVVLGLVLVALAAWVNSLQLDSIEARRLNGPFITTSVIRHLQITAMATVLVLVLAVPTGILLTRPFARPIVPPILALGNVGQAIPSIGVIALLAVTIGIGLQVALIALVAYAFLPVLRNTMVGLEQVDRAQIEAGLGMGMTPGQVLRRIELPLAVPVILAGVRTALVITVGAAALAHFISAGGLGDVIVYGIAQNRFPVTLTGGVLTAVIALLVDWLAGIAEDFLRPKGL